MFPLPVPTTPLIGREQEVTAVVGLLLQPTTRLVTLTGPGGTGKTRLSLAIAVAVRSAFRDGVAVVSLAAVSTPELVPAAIAHVLNVGEATNQTVVQRLSSHLRDKQLMLVLDNFEHLLPVATHIAALLNEAPDIKILVTSRASLRLTSEHEFPVPPLPLPDLQNLPSYNVLATNEAIVLFAARATAVKPDFQLTDTNVRTVAEICVRLDGLPLTIELAAARVKLLPPHALLARLGDRLGLLTGGARDVPLRHKTLRNTIDWSYHLLQPEEQRLFVCLAVFVGGWTLEAAEFVCDVQNTHSLAVLDGLQTLVDNSLLRQIEDLDGMLRFDMLETIREYAVERLEHSPLRSNTRRQHAAYYLILAEAAEWELTRTNRITWVRRIETEYSNLLAALEWSRYQHEADANVGLLLAGALAQFWEARGYLYEGRKWLTELLLLNEHQIDVASRADQLAERRQAARARALHGAGILAHSQGDIATADAELAESVRLFRSMADKHRLAAALTMHARVVWQLGDAERSVTLCEEALRLAREVNDQWIIADVLYDLGSHQHSQGDLVAARARYEASLTICRQVGFTRGTASALSALGEVAAAQGDITAARTYYQQSLALLRELEDKADFAWSLQMLGWSLYSISDHTWLEGILRESLELFQVVDDRLGLAWALNRLGDFYRWLAQDEQSERYYIQSLDAFRELGHKQGGASVMHNLGYIALRRNDVQQAHQWFDEALAVFNELEHKWSCADCLAGLAAVAIAAQQADHAVRLLSSAQAIQHMIDPSGTSREPPNQAEWDRTISAIRLALDVSAFDAGWSAGQTMTLERAIAYAQFPWSQQMKTEATAAAEESGRATPPSGLTERELQVLRLAATGMTNAQIAEQLIISPRTVNAHLNSIYGKIGVTTRSGATRFAFDHGLTQ